MSHPPGLTSAGSGVHSGPQVTLSPLVLLALGANRGSDMCRCMAESELWPLKCACPWGIDLPTQTARPLLSPIMSMKFVLSGVLLQCCYSGLFCAFQGWNSLPGLCHSTHSPAEAAHLGFLGSTAARAGCLRRATLLPTIVP